MELADARFNNGEKNHYAASLDIASFSIALYFHFS